MCRFRSPAPLLLIASLLLGSGLLACSGTDETSIVTDDEDGPIPTSTDARDALNEALQSFNDHCLLPAAQRNDAYPLSLFNPNSSAPSFAYRQLQALAQAGLLDTTIARGERGIPVHRFSLTDDGREAQYEIAQGQKYRPMFCYAIPRVDRIDSIKAVYTSGPNPLAKVWFTYKHRAPAPWIEAEGVQRVFSNRPPMPSENDTIHTTLLLMRTDSAWVDRRLTGFDRLPDRPSR